MIKIKIEEEEGELIDDELLDECEVKAQTSTEHLKRISGGVLQLNFMKKSFNQIASSEKKDKKHLNEQNKIYPTVLRADDEPVPGKDGITRDERFTWLEKLEFGRFSYNGQNAEIEKLMNCGNPTESDLKEIKEEGECVEDEEEDIKPVKTTLTYSADRNPRKRKNNGPDGGRQKRRTIV